MIRNIIDLLEIVKDGSENVRLAKGKYYLPEDLKGGIKQIKKEVKWRRK
jgi:hypothetical protein